ncbi:MAG: hypothetical protein OXI41_02030 [Chloroflexota bacterium]|nr:hypothetical protein [Chloroflexota bacterium]MDE2894350.1 hypothetical protein [Chloroflexota bacterium]
MNIGDTFFGLDQKGHLWIIVSEAGDDGRVAAVNFTTHDPVRRSHCGADCLVIGPGEHPYPTHDSCIFYQRAALPDLSLIREHVASGRYEAHEPVSAPLLERIQLGALISKAREPVKAAIRRDLR